jgi:hypothetical protein
MTGRKTAVVGILIGGLVLFTGACGRQTSVAPVASGVASSPEDDQLPFERAAQKSGISPTSSVIPPGANLPVGTPISIHLQSTISSAHERAGDRFQGVLDEPIVVNGETLAERGVAVTGRVIEARRVSPPSSPGYLRLVVTSLPILGKSTMIHTSSTFLKGARPAKLNVAPGIGAADKDLLVAAETTRATSAALAATRRRTHSQVRNKDWYFV